MPTSFELSQLILISAAYLLLLFGVAWTSEKGLIPRWVIRHPLTYTLSLGVYASAWAFYGSVGLAYQYGYGFLACYLGVSGAFLLAPVLLYPILKITRTYQLSSLADLLAFRFRSTWAGALTTSRRSPFCSGSCCGLRSSNFCGFSDPKYFFASRKTCLGSTSPTTTRVALFGAYQRRYHSRASLAVMCSRSFIQPITGRP